MNCEFCGESVDNLIKHKNQFHESMAGYEYEPKGDNRIIDPVTGRDSDGFDSDGYDSRGLTDGRRGAKSKSQEISRPITDKECQLAFDKNWDELTQSEKLEMHRILADESFVEDEHPRAGDGKFTSGGGSAHAGKSEKDLVKGIKGGSADWKDWYRNETNEELYKEIENRNRAVPFPQRPEGVGATIFRDDPEAVSKMENKIKYLEDVQDYWKKIIKFPARDYHTKPHQLGDAKWYELTGAGANLRDAKKKLEQIKAQHASGTQLVRKPTYKDGKKRFFYDEQQPETPSTEAYNTTMDEMWLHASQDQRKKLLKTLGYNDDWARLDSIEEIGNRGGGMLRRELESVWSTLQSRTKDDLDVSFEVEFVKPTMWHCEDCDTDLGNGVNAGKHQDETGHHNIAKKRVSEVLGESWDFKSNEERWTKFEKIGFSANEAITMANLTWADLSQQIKNKLGEVEEADKEEKRNDSYDAFNNEGEHGTTTGQDIDYNKIFESTTLRTKYECEHCNAGFKSNESLMTHFNDIHAKSTDNNGCLYCNENISPENMVEHLAYEHAFVADEDHLEGARHQMHNDVKKLNNQDVQHGGFDWQEGHEVKETCSYCFGEGCEVCKGTGELDPDHMNEPFSNEADDSDEEAKNKIEDYYKHSFTGMAGDKIKDWDEKQKTAKESDEYWRNTFSNPHGYDCYQRCSVCGADVDGCSDDGTRMTDSKLKAHYDEHNKKGEIPHFDEVLANEDHWDEIEKETGKLDGQGRLDWINNRMKQLHKQDPRTYAEWQKDQEASENWKKVASDILIEHQKKGKKKGGEALAVEYQVLCQFCSSTFDLQKNDGKCEYCGKKNTIYGEAVSNEYENPWNCVKRGLEHKWVDGNAPDGTPDVYCQTCGEIKVGEAIAVEDDLDDTMMKKPKSERTVTMTAKQFRDSLKENFTGKCPECGTYAENEVDEFCLNCGASFDENDNVSESLDEPELECPECNSSKVHPNRQKGDSRFGQGKYSCNNCGATFGGENIADEDIDISGNDPEGNDVVNSINKHASRGGKYQKIRESKKDPNEYPDDSEGHIDADGNTVWEEDRIGEAKSDCMMGGKHVPIDSPDKFDPFNACTKCGDDIRLKDGIWTTTTYDERQKYLKNNSWEAKPKEENLSNVIDRVNKNNAPADGWDESDYVGEGDYEPSSNFFDADIEQRNDGYHVVQDLPTDKRSHDVEAYSEEAQTCKNGHFTFSQTKKKCPSCGEPFESNVTDGSGNIIPTDELHRIGDEAFDPMNPNAGEAWANEGWFECQDCKFFSTNQEDADKHKETGHDVGSFGFSSVMPYSKGNTV